MIPQAYAQYEKTVTVGCVTYQSIWGDKRANLDKIKGLIREAASRGIDIVAFPELALSGYESNEDCTLHQDLAETIPGPATEEIQVLATELDIYVILGMPERDTTNPDLCYISCALIGPEGLVGRYRKLHLGPPPIFAETLSFNAVGDEVPVFDTRFGPIGIQICGDFWSFPELSRIQMMKGARIIFNCTASPDAPNKPYYLVQQTGARATENLVYTASANMVGIERTVSFYGTSTIAGPDFPAFSKVYAQGERREEIVSATLSFEKLHRFRSALDLVALRKSDVMLEEFKQLARENRD
ncbi:MAG: carbon-nitrogen hydrolase family protein [Pseudomonadales bacterium]